MGNFDIKGHGLSSAKDRLERAKKIPVTYRKGKWKHIDDIIDQVYKDICSGVPRADIIKKLADCAYEGQRKGVKERTAVDYIAAARERLKLEFDEDAEAMRENLYGKIMAVYTDAMKSKDRYNAIQAINTLMKLTGVAVDKPQTAIQINSDKENGVTINFGFSEEKDENISDSQ